MKKPVPQDKTKKQMDKDEYNTLLQAVLHLTNSVLAGPDSKSAEDTKNNYWLSHAAWLRNASLSRLTRPPNETDAVEWAIQRERVKQAAWAEINKSTPQSTCLSTSSSSNSYSLVNQNKTPWNKNEDISKDALEYIRYSG